MRAKQQQLQKKTFTRWVNTHLDDRKREVKDLSEDMEDGVNLINLMEVISGKKIGKYKKKPKMHIQKLENLNKALQFIKSEGITLVNIGSTDLNTGNLTIILGLIWTLILRYQIQKGDGGGSAKSALLDWVNKQIAPKKIKNFTDDWRDGDTLCKLLNSLAPGAVAQSGDPLKDTESAMAAAEKQLEIPRVMDAADLCGQADELSTMTYVSYFRDASQRPLPASTEQIDASTEKSYAEGSGLVGASISDPDPAEFLVHFLDAQGRPVKPSAYQVTVTDPHGAAVPVSATDKGTGLVACLYKPVTTGKYTVDVQTNGGSIKDMPLKVSVGSSADPNKTIVKGRGCETATDNDVEPAHFQVYTRTARNKPVAGEVTVKVTDPKGKGVPAAVHEADYGEYDVDWRPLTTGEHTLEVFVDGKPVKGWDPKIVNVLQGAVASLTSKAAFQFTLWTVAPDGEPETEGGQRFECTVVDDEGIPIAVDPSDNKDGSYSAKYHLTFNKDAKTGHEKHHWLVTAMVNGTHIPGSPFEHDMRGRKFEQVQAPLTLATPKSPPAKAGAGPQRRFPKARQSVIGTKGGSLLM